MIPAINEMSRVLATRQAAFAPVAARAAPVAAAKVVNGTGARMSQAEFFALPVEARARQMQLLVCDMAGTTVHEGGLVYETLQRVMCEAGLDVQDDEMIAWHGAQKTEVVQHFVLNRLMGEDSTGDAPTRIENAGHGGDSSAGQLEGGAYDSFRPWSGHQPARPVLVNKLAEFLCDQVDNRFEVEIQEAYFGADTSVRLIHDDLPRALAELRAAGCKVALNTGYPAKIQAGLIETLGLAEHVDAYVCSGDVPKGRPYPYMTQLCMWKTETADARYVAKAGDTNRDIEEGQQAGCGLTIGVLTGAAGRETLVESGADVVLESIVDFAHMRC